MVCRTEPRYPEVVHKLVAWTLSRLDALLLQGLDVMLSRIMEAGLEPQARFVVAKYFPDRFVDQAWPTNATQAPRRRAEPS